MRKLAVAAAAAVLGLAMSATSATAQNEPWTVVATGLDNPRHLSMENGNLYIAEAGRGGDGSCMPAGDGDDPQCLGLTGAITKVGASGQSRIITGLPSIAVPSGVEAAGPTDVAMQGGRHYRVSMGLGTDPAARDALPGADKLGTVLAGTLPDPQTRVIGDLAAFEGAHDPDGQGADSNPGGIATWQGRNVAVDAGGNSVLWVGPGGRVSTIATLPTQMATAPPFLGLPPGAKIPADSVPTSLAVGPDGALYVSELTGFPFEAGSARVFRIAPGGQPTVWATGLTNVTDLSWYHGKLYAVQIADTGLLATGDALPVGSLVRVNGGTSVTPIATGLTAPYGVALANQHAYVTTCSTCVGDGQVVKISLAAAPVAAPMPGHDHWR